MPNAVLSNKYLSIHDLYAFYWLQQAWNDKNWQANQRKIVSVIANARTILLLTVRIVVKRLGWSAVATKQTVSLKKPYRYPWYWSERSPLFRVKRKNRDGTRFTILKPNTTKDLWCVTPFRHPQLRANKQINKKCDNINHMKNTLSVQNNWRINILNCKSLHKF